MRVYSVLLFLAFLLCRLTVSAQYLVGSRVSDTSGEPVEAAVFSFLRSGAGTILEQGVTDREGGFRARVEGEVQLYVSCLGFKPYLSEPFVVDRDMIRPVIVLSADSMVLDDVVVVGEQLSPSLRVENGKMIFTPAKSSVTAGGTALDVLNKTPGVFVDGQNNISMGGRNSVAVILNGRQTYMQKEELVALLKATPSSSVTSVEVIHNPSAKYDAEGSGGVININMDRRHGEGFSLMMNNGLSYWSRWRQNTEFSVGYTHDKLSLTGNYSHAMGSYNLEYGMRRLQNGKYYNSPTWDTDKKKSISGNLNLDYTFNPRHKISVRTDINTLFGPGVTHTVTDIRDAEDLRLEQMLIAENDYYRQKGNRYGGGLFYEATPREGESYSFDVNYAWFDGCSRNRQPNRYLSADGEVLSDKLYRSNNFRHIHIFAVAHDQQHPLWGGDLKAGVKYSRVSANNGAQLFEVIGGEALLDESQSNRFAYNEQLVAGYLLYTRVWREKLTFEAGLRGEATFSEGELRTVDATQDQTHHRDEFELFPSVNFGWAMGGDHRMSLSYSQRIDRPAYQDLNPFEYMLDELSCWRGNPFLRPQKSHALVWNYTHRNTSLSASYTYIGDHRAQVTDTVSVSKVMMIPRNVGTQQQVALNLFQSVNWTRWWRTGIHLTGYYIVNDVAFDAQRRFNPDGFAGIVTLQNTLHLPWNILMELNGSFQTRRLGSANEYKRPTGYVDLGFSRSFSDNRWRVSLALRDMFWTSRWDDYSAYGDFRLWNWGKSESRRVNFNVTYRFGKQKNAAHDRHFDEIDRL